MPVRALLKSRFVVPLTLQAGNAVPFTWDGSPGSVILPGGRYLPHQLAAELERELRDATGDAVVCFAKPVLDDASGALSALELRVRNEGAFTLVLARSSESFSLPVAESAPLRVGAAFGSADLGLDPGEEGALCTWPITGSRPLHLPRRAFELQQRGRVDAESDTGRRISWAGRAHARLKARLLAVPRSAALAPPDWSLGGACWSGTDAPLRALFGPGSAALAGAPLFLLPDDRNARMVALQLEGAGATLARRVHGFLDIGFEASEPPVPDGLRVVGAEYADDFSGDLSAWSGPAAWSINAGVLEVDTSGAASQLIFDETLGDCELESALQFLATPAEGESVQAGLGLYLGGFAYVGIALRVRRQAGADVCELVTWTSGTPLQSEVLATLERKPPTAEPVALRVQLSANAAGHDPQVLHARAWVGGEGPFRARLDPGMSIPAARNPIAFYQDDLASDPGAEARFDDFIARELRCDFGPELLALETLEID